jgi:hypothetical protein
MSTATTSRARARRRDLRHVEGDREGEHDVGKRHQRRDQDRAEHDVPVDRGLDQLLEVLEAGVVDDLAAEVVELPERCDEQDRERSQIRDQQPADRPRQQQRQLKAGPAPEVSGYGRQMTSP